MITADIKCPRCPHTEPVSIKLIIFTAHLVKDGRYALELETEILDRDEVTERFNAHYRTAHQGVAEERQR